jgi:hypothetical protein
MSVFFELTTDTFKDRFDQIGPKDPVVVRAGAPSVRRPLRGLEVKEDTFAVLKVIDMLGREIKLYDSGSLEGKSSSYTNFILQGVNEARQEKFQVVETFGDPYIFFYGEAPRFLDCVSILINSQDFNWQAEFWANYDAYLRGSKCAEVGARVYMFYDDKIVEGYMLQASAANDANNPMSVQLQFKLFLTNYRNISMVGNPNFPIRLGVDVSFATQGNEVVNLKTGERSLTRLRSLIIDNQDEWTGPQPPVETTDGVDETDDLIRAAVENAAANSANMNNADSIADSGLTNANNGKGTAGQRPSPKPNAYGATTTESESNCVSGSQFTGSDGSLYCKTVDDRTIRIGNVNAPDCPPNTSVAGCPSSPPDEPPGTSSTGPTAPHPLDTTDSSTGATSNANPPPASSSSGDGTTGAFASSAVPSSVSRNNSEGSVGTGR